MQETQIRVAIDITTMGLLKVEVFAYKITTQHNSKIQIQNIDGEKSK